MNGDPLEKLGLDPKGQYVGFDYWADRFVSPFTGTLRHELPAASCKVVSIYAQLERPQLVSTSRHITQGIVDVLEEKWDTGKRTLSGVSLVVADDPYELRVIVPGKGASWHVAAATVEGGAGHLHSGRTSGARDDRSEVNRSASLACCFRDETMT